MHVRPAASATLPFGIRHPRLLLVLFCLLLWLPGLATLPPSDRDESRFAQATKQMLESGDAVRIRNGDEDRNRKPIGIYWLQLPFAAAARAAGIAEANPIWPYRLPSLLGAVVAVLATWGIGRRLFGPREALLAGAMLAGCVILTVEAHIAKTDAALLGATTLAMGVLALAYRDPGSVRPRDAALFWLAMAVGVLLKGPLTPMIAGLAAAGLAAADRRARWLLSLRPGWGVPLMLAAVLPWFAAIGIATGGRFFQDAVGGDLGRKLTSGDDAHWGPPGLHLVLLPLLAFPASLPVLRALPGAWRNRADPATRFLLAWIVPSWLVFEAVPTKLPHYTLPLYPALMLLAAHWLLAPLPAARWWRGVSLGLGLLAAGLLAVGAVALPPVLHAPFWMGLPGLLAAALLAALVWRQRMVAAVLAAPLLYWAILGWELPRLDALWISPRAAAALRGEAPSARFGAVGFHEPSLRFLAGTDAQFLPDGPEGARALTEGRIGAVLVGNRDLAAFLAEAGRLGARRRWTDSTIPAGAGSG